MSGEFVVVTDMLTHTENGADYGIFLITSCRMLYSAGQNRTVPDGFPPKACGNDEEQGQNGESNARTCGPVLKCSAGEKPAVKN
jgi:hypothetical protein